MISTVNNDLERGIKPSDMQGLLQEWVWLTDPEEDLHPKVLFNKNQLVGLLYCRSLPKQECDMTLQEVLDGLENICKEWPLYIAKYTDPEMPENQKVYTFVELCMTRFAELATHALPSAVLDNAMLTEEYNQSLRKLTGAAVRRLLNTFLILQRHFYLFRKCENVPAESFDCKIRRPHVEASMDEFDVLCMHFFIPVGARLRYKNDFRGMYNHISQVMYFHNPDFTRIPRLPWDQVAATGDCIQVLPALRELFPEIPIWFEEDDFYTKKWDWAWLLVPGRVYLLAPDHSIYHSPDITTLFSIYSHKRAAV